MAARAASTTVSTVLGSGSGSVANVRPVPVGTAAPVGDAKTTWYPLRRVTLVIQKPRRGGERFEGAHDVQSLHPGITTMTTDRINPASVVGRLSSTTCIPQIRPYAVRLALYCFPLGPTHDDSAEVSLRRPALRPRVPIAHCRGHWRFRNHGHARISLRLDPRNLPGDARRHPVIEVRAVADQAVNGNIRVVVAPRA